MIKVTVNDVLNASNVFQELMKQNFKGATSFKIAKLIKELDKEIKTFDETRDKLIQEYADKNEDGTVKVDDEGNVHVGKEYVSTFNEQIQQILAVEIEINSDKIPENCFDNIDMTPSQSYAIMEFVE